MGSPDHLSPREHGAAFLNRAAPSDHSQPRLDSDHPEDHADDHEQGHALGWLDALRIAAVALAAVAVWFHLWEPFPAVSVIGVLGLLIGGWPIVKEAAENALARRMTME